jgi:hypothetical protein
MSAKCKVQNAKFHASRFTFLVLRVASFAFTPYTLRLPFHVSRVTRCVLCLYALRLTPYLSRFPLSASRLPLSVFRFTFLVLLSVSFLVGCGRKTIVRPPELIAPEPVNDLALEAQTKGLVLRWGRVQKSVGGEDLDDLAGFVVLRAEQDAQGKTGEFAEVATIPVEDRDRFRKNKKFTYTDERLAIGALYRYRVLAFTLDGYYGGASNTVEIVWKKAD